MKKIAIAAIRPIGRFRQRIRVPRMMNYLSDEHTAAGYLPEVRGDKKIPLRVSP